MGGKNVTNAGVGRQLLAQPKLAIDAIYRQQFGLWHLPLFDKVASNGSVADAEELQGVAAPGLAQQEPWGDFEKGPRGQVYRMPIAIRPATAVGQAASPWYQLPNEPMISVRGKVKVTKTTINRGNGGKGTVSEEEHLEDYSVSIQGIAYNELENQYPEEDMKQIRRHFERPGYLEVKNYFLNQIWGITYIKIEDVRADRFERLTERWAPYTADGFSVTDFDLS